MKVLTNDATSCTNYPLIDSLKTLDDRLDKCILEMHQLKKISCFECIISVTSSSTSESYESALS